MFILLYVYYMFISYMFSVSSNQKQFLIDTPN